MMSPAHMDGSTPFAQTNDLDEVELGEGGSFSVVLSAERPDGHDGDWWELDPGRAGS